MQACAVKETRCQLYADFGRAGLLPEVVEALVVDCCCWVVADSTERVDHNVDPSYSLIGCRGSNVVFLEATCPQPQGCEAKLV